MGMKKSEIKIICDVLIDAQNRIEKYLQYPLAHDEKGIAFGMDRENVFTEVESGLYNIIKELKANHVA